MKLAYDTAATALYIELAPRAHLARTVELDDCTNADLDQDGRLLGIEVLRPGTRWPLAEILKRYEVSEDDAHMLMCGYPFSYAWTVT